jgi:hypothetical protein
MAHFDEYDDVLNQADYFEDLWDTDEDDRYDRVERSRYDYDFDDDLMSPEIEEDWFEE